MIRLTYSTIEFNDAGALTCFGEGRETQTFAHDTPHYHVIAHRCGYGDDILRYAQEHDFVHLFLWEKLFDTSSSVLWAEASNQPNAVPIAVAALEEIAVMTFQRWLRANERPIVGGVDWDALKAEALQLLEAEHARR